MKKILFVCAMEKEAIRITEKLKMNQISNNLYEREDVRLLITGIGKQLTAINLTQYLNKNERPDLIINVGYAGSTDIPVGSWVNISRAYNYEWDTPGEVRYMMSAGGSQKLELLDNYSVQIENVECYSAEGFVTKTHIKGHVAFDMELHSISLICDLYEIPLISLKKISDNLNFDDYSENIQEKEVFELESCLEFFRFF